MATKTETQINELKINYLTEAQYEEALANNEINDNEIYMTPASENTNTGGGETSNVNTTYSLSKSGSTITLTGSDGSTSSVTDSNTTYSNASTSAAGLMSSSDKEKLDGIESDANNYSLPTASKSTLGGVKTTSSVTSTSGLTACPIISGVPYYKDTNTTYNEATTSTAGLMSASDKEKLDGLNDSGSNIEIRTGLITFSSLNAGAGTYQNVSFSSNMSSTPTVMLTLTGSQIDDTYSLSDNFTVWTTETTISKSGFRVNVRNNGENAGIAKVRYLAIATS